MNAEAVSIHNLLSSAPNTANKAQWHFTMRQIVLLGWAAGLSGATFAARLKDIAMQEQLDKDQKRYKEFLDMLSFAERSYKLGEHLGSLRAKIDLAIATNIKIMKDVKGKTPKAKYADRLQQLKEDRIELNGYSQQLDDIEEQRLETSSTEELAAVEGLFAKLTKRYKAFLDSIKNRRSSTSFNFGSSPIAGQEDDIVYEPEVDGTPRYDANLDFDIDLDPDFDPDAENSPPPGKTGRKKKSKKDGPENEAA